MKVGLFNENKPLPFPGGLLGAGLSFAGNTLGTTLTNSHNEKMQAYQMKHDKDMASLGQQYALEQMEKGQELEFAKMDKQNQYQLEQWQRENEYNDPSAVAARYRAAGINPRAAFGTGSASGAGIAGGLSSAPSGGSPSGSAPGSASNIMMPAPGGLSHLGSDMANGFIQGSRLQAQNRKDQADADKAEMEAKGKKYDNEILAPLRAQLQSALKNKAVSEAEISKITAQWEPYMAEMRSRALEGNIANIEAQTNTFISQLENDNVYRSLTEEQKNLVKKEIIESESRVKRMAVQNAFDNAQTKLASVQSEVAKSQKELNEALKNKEAKMLPYLDKQIELLGTQMNLNNEQIKKWKAEIAQQWTKIGTDIAFNTVAEARQWVGMFMPFGKSNPIGFGKR